MEYFAGTTRIKNPKTLRKWLRFGWYQERIEAGLVFNPACGRFREEICTCSTCRNKKGKKLVDVLNEFGY
jgi:hypothetical protein